MTFRLIHVCARWTLTGAYSTSGWLLRPNIPGRPIRGLSIPLFIYNWPFDQSSTLPSELLLRIAFVQWIHSQSRLHQVLVQVSAHEAMDGASDLIISQDSPSVLSAFTVLLQQPCSPTRPKHWPLWCAGHRLDESSLVILHLSPYTFL